MKEFISFVQGFLFAALMAACMVLGATAVLEFNRDAATAGYIIISKKLYVLTPAEIRDAEPAQPTGQICNVE